METDEGKGEERRGERKVIFIFSCEGAALEVLMSVCLSVCLCVCNLKF